MTRMRELSLAAMPRLSRRFGFLSACLLACVVAGCGPNDKDMKIEDLRAENEALKGQLSDKDRLLNDALVRENDAQGTIDQLNQELSKSKIAKNTDGWITMPSFDMISIPGEVLFESGKAELTASGRSRLSQIASDIRSRYGDRDIYVFGHTDNEPIRKSKWKDNWELGAHRSLTLVRSLNGHGIPSSQLVQANCGENRPRASNSSGGGKQQNRRVEFYAVKRGNIADRTASASQE